MRSGGAEGVLCGFLSLGCVRCGGEAKVSGIRGVVFCRDTGSGVEWVGGV